ncbi:hypothetical protein MBSD_n0324 [Mizugakiibacter sediminis]|uniref:Uncharacterized protein n=1 Tax=Mizugakiibacter sediminis TaxID=1475481 RepID=A0A0K8QK02_9GAMM|nr:hypothetical protein [Mizugakiibacter sediminis]GAP65036.1 hypothetical protein MBSD_n0324 [Mizugakiibacter sediminis]
MKTFAWLLKREYWEHRGGFLWTPVWISVAILILTLMGIVTTEVFRVQGHVQMGISLDRIHADMSESDIVGAGQALDYAQLVLTAIPAIALFFVLFFYLLGALYDDRRDRSVLFWKSLPISDTATVLSKTVTAMLVAPLIALAVATAGYLALLALITLWTALHGVNALPVIAAAHPLGMAWRLLLTVPVDALWALPCIGWLLFWSSSVRSKPFLWAVLVPVVAITLNAWFGAMGLPHIDGSTMAANAGGRLLLGIAPGAAWHAQGLGRGIPGDDAMQQLAPSHVLGTLATPELWIGVLVGAALIGGAIWFRRWRDDS